MRMKNKDRFYFFISLIVISLVGMILRWTGIPYIGVDYEVCFLPWYEDLKASGGLHGLVEFKGDYNMFYASLLYFLTLIPVPPLISIKMLSIVFDYFLAIVVLAMVVEVSPEEKKWFYGSIAYGLVLLNPLVVMNSAYLSQSEGIWCSLALCAFWLFWKQHPVGGGMFLGFAIAMKPQAFFILPIILIYYFKSRRFSLLHFLWVPVGIQLTCIPAIIGGCSFDIFIRRFIAMLKEYPYVYYYYPNIWTYLQEAPYYAFGRTAIFSTFTVLLLFAVLYIKSRQEVTLQDMFLYITWTAMTCAMLLPCMHERYNYLAEVMLVVCAIREKRYRIPALILQLVSMQCNGQSYLDWPWVSHYALAAFNVAVYLYLTRDCMLKLYRAGLPERGDYYAKNRA